MGISGVGQPRICGGDVCSADWISRVGVIIVIIPVPFSSLIHRDLKKKKLIQVRF